MVPFVAAYPSVMLQRANCNLPLVKGSIIMGNPAVNDNSTANQLVVKRGIQISSGTTVYPGETITITYPGSAKQYLIQVTNAQMSTSGPGCNATRLATAMATFTVPSIDGQTISIVGAYDNSSALPVKILNTFVLFIGKQSKPSSEGTIAPVTVTSPPMSSPTMLPVASSSSSPLMPPVVKPPLAIPTAYSSWSPSKHSRGKAEIKKDIELSKVQFSADKKAAKTALNNLKTEMNQAVHLKHTTQGVVE